MRIPKGWDTGIEIWKDRIEILSIALCSSRDVQWSGRIGLVLAERFRLLFSHRMFFAQSFLENSQRLFLTIYGFLLLVLTMIQPSQIMQRDTQVGMVVTESLSVYVDH